MIDVMIYGLHILAALVLIKVFSENETDREDIVSDKEGSS